MRKTKGQLKTGLAVTCTTVMMASVLAACGGGDPVSDSAKTTPGSTSTAQKQIKFSMMSPFYGQQPPATDDTNAAFKAIQEQTNSKLDITFVPGASYNDKLNVTIASGNLPQAMVVLDTKNSAIINAVRSGAFWEIGPYLKDFPKISKYWNEKIANNISVDGKIYGLYRDRPFARKGIIFRQDWLDNLGLQQPKTVDDLYNVAKAFTLNDPDKNGKNDTYGLTLTDDNLITDASLVLVTALGGFNQWGVQDGKVIPDFMTKEYMDSLKLLKKMYDEKLINQDFGAIKGTKLHENINSGKAGIYLASIDDAPNKHADLYKLNPKAKMDFVIGLQGPKGVKLPANSGYSGVFMFPKSSVKTEAELKDILTYFEKNLQDDVLKTFAWGVEGVHYKTENGNPLFTNEQLYKDQVGDLGQLRIAPSTLAWPTEPDMGKKVKKLYEEGMPNAVPSVIEPFLSPTKTQLGAELDKLINDARVRFIMGEVDEAGFTKVTEEWSKKGGDKIIEEFTAEYKKAQQK
ncbi:extracellular solute-binding protein [Paenibacillus sp. LMG 31461]|uniref:Extracellular solute-binding protein n=1 Tax=Paenibacillus plantarum TaxID=2654975 RepID=A0ABX1XH85_9BACL|nr:extracellular solute-binding protein [Paenibacillus plantarum]NOU67796.1 extracellular solute-binding protein [Paenibacillus plantarum]